MCVMYRVLLMYRYVCDVQGALYQSSHKDVCV